MNITIQYHFGVRINFMTKSGLLNAHRRIQKEKSTSGCSQHSTQAVGGKLSWADQ